MTEQEAAEADAKKAAWDAGIVLGEEHARVVDEAAMTGTNWDVRESFFRGYRRAGRLNPKSPVHAPVPPTWSGGGHYSINWIAPEHAWEWLRQKFPQGKASDSCWIALSTSGVHGTYCTLDDLPGAWADFERDGETSPPEVTFICTEPRLVRTCYGNVPVGDQEEVEWLRSLVASSLEQQRFSQAENLPKCSIRDTTTGSPVKCNEPAGHFGPHLDATGARTDGSPS